MLANNKKQMETGVTLPSVSNRSVSIAVIGNPGSRRVELFQAALKELGLPRASLIDWHNVLIDIQTLDKALAELPADTIIRIESPGKEFEVERLLLAVGADQDDPEACYARLSPHAIEALTFEKGRILPSRQWYLGFQHVLQQIASRVQRFQLMNTPPDIALMFDKRACHAQLKQADIAVPESLAPIESYEMLIAQMRSLHCTRVFVKLAHSSSASGVVAYRFNGNLHQAITTVEMVRENGTWCLYNSRHIRTYDDQRLIAALIDELCQHRVHVEQWIPKAGFQGKAFDLRVVMIAGQMRHTVVRMSHSPITNLHLLNERGDIQALLARIGSENLELIRQTCENTARQFTSLYSGIDLLLTPGFRHHAVLEINTFGDLLPGVLDRGQDTYTAEILAALGDRYDRSA